MVEAFHPATLGEALRIREHSGAVPFAGGTDLMVKLGRGTGVLPAFQGPVLFLDGCGELKTLAERDGTVEAGSMVTLSALARSPIVPPALREIVLQMAAPGLRNVATMGGNICNASPAGDTLPFLYAFEAKVRLVSSGGERTMPLEDFIAGPGTTRLGPEELLHSVSFPAWNPAIRFYRKVGTRRANALTKVSIAAFADLSEGLVARARIAVGAVAPTVVRLRAIEEMLQGAGPRDRERMAEAARRGAEEAVRPIDDQRSTAEYRRQVAAGLAGLFVEQALGG